MNILHLLCVYCAFALVPRIVEGSKAECRNATLSHLLQSNESLKAVQNDYFDLLVDGMKDDCLQLDTNALRACTVDLRNLTIDAQLTSLCQANGGSIWRCQYMPKCSRNPPVLHIGPIPICASNLCDTAGVRALVPHAMLLGALSEVGHSCAVVFRCHSTYYS